MGKHVVFDVVGTCVVSPHVVYFSGFITYESQGYQAFFDAIDHRLGDKLRAEGIKPKLLGFAWIEAAEREYTYLAISGKYVTFTEVFEALFYRMLWMAGIEEPRKFATDEDNTYIQEGYNKLTLRPGLKECFQKLRDAGITVWCLTAGDITRVRGYLLDAGVPMPEENFTSVSDR